VLSNDARLIQIVPVSPAASAAFVGGAVTFAAILPNYQNYFYQWQFIGTNISGANAAALNLNNISAGSAGSYAVVATFGTVTVTSAPVTLSILAAPAQTYSNTIAADAPVAWWRLDDAPGSSSVTDVYGNNSGFSYSQNNDVVFGVEGAVLGDTNPAARFTGYSAGSRANLAKIEVPFNPTLNNNSFTVELWALVAGGAGTTRSPLTSREASTGVAHGYAFYAGADNSWQFHLGDGSSFLNIPGPAVNESRWTYLVGTYDGVNAAFYVNGALAWSGPAVFAPNASAVLRLGAGATESATGNFYFPGRLDEVAIYSSALNAARIQAHYAAAFPANSAPRFTQQTSSRAVLSGTSYTLFAKAHHLQPLTYQWQQNGTNLSGATNASLSLSSASQGNAGTYQLIAKNGSYAATNSPFTVSVLTGEAVSGNILVFDTDTVANHGGYAGYVAVTNWNEFGYGLASGNVTNLLNNFGQPSGVTATWSAATERHWAGPLSDNSGDSALLNGFLDTTASGAISLSLTGIPTNYQTAGYSLYLYFGEPPAATGIVGAGDSFGAISVGNSTNYYHGIDLAQWNGEYARGTNSDATDPAPAEANYAVFTNLNSASVTVVVTPHPHLGGPASLSGFQLVANVTSNPALSISHVGNNLVITWTGTGVLQSKRALTDVWQDVTGASSPYTIPTPLSDQQYYRLR